MKWPTRVLNLKRRLPQKIRRSWATACRNSVARWIVFMLRLAVRQDRTRRLQRYPGNWRRILLLLVRHRRGRKVQRIRQRRRVLCHPLVSCPTLPRSTAVWHSSRQPWVSPAPRTPSSQMETPSPLLNPCYLLWTTLPRVSPLSPVSSPVRPLPPRFQQWAPLHPRRPSQHPTSKPCQHGSES